MRSKVLQRILDNTPKEVDKYIHDKVVKILNNGIKKNKQNKMDTELKNNIKSKFPSICHNCIHGRRPAADKNRDDGWSGCAHWLRKYHNDNESETEFLKQYKEIGWGWVYPNVPVFGDKSFLSGGIVNDALLVNGAERCGKFEKK